MKFTNSGGTVTLAAARTADQVVITVSDTGIGIPVEEQDKLFTRFFRSSTATANAVQGTGLGLSIVKNIVELHQGRIGATSRPGRGTTMTVTLPVRPGKPTGERLADLPDAT